MLQELIPGDDTHGVNYNCYMWDGEPLVEFTAQKLRLSPPGFGAPCAIVSRQIPEVVEPGRRILRALGFNGYACVEFKRDARDGVYKLMEVNGRVNLSLLLSVRCGINFAWLMYRHLVFGERPKAQAYRSGVYWLEGAKDAYYGAVGIAGGRISLRSFLRPYVGPHVFAIADLRDVRPALKRYADYLRIGARRGLSSLVPSRRTH
jgi:D-aspartate ligase